MDPQQRILLHTALDALQDAGYSPDASPTFQKDSFGVYVGVATGDYVDNSRDNIDVYYSTGTLRAFLSGRISYAFGFGGPSVVIDTACSSSLVALYQACRSLQNEDCKSALAGGVNVISSPDVRLPKLLKKRGSELTGVDANWPLACPLPKRDWTVQTI